MEYVARHNFALVVLPDAGSNDYEQHLELINNNIEIIILDHHEAAITSPNAIVINNQLCNYPNKELSGAGVTWQFCRYLDSILDKNIANNYLDLVALGNMADMMSLKSIETKHLILKGFKDENLKNPFIYGMAQKNSFSLGNHITPMGAAFYIAPFVNAMVRSGGCDCRFSCRDYLSLHLYVMPNHRHFSKRLAKSEEKTWRNGVWGGEERCVEERTLNTLSTSVGETIKVHEKLLSICHGRVVFCV